MRGRTHYFRSPTLLNRYYFIADADLLGLDGTAEGIVTALRAEGTDAAAPLRLICVRYRDGAPAAAALARLRAGLAPDADAEGLARTESGTWIGARATGRVLVAVFEAPNREAATAALGAVEARLRAQVGDER